MAKKMTLAQAGSLGGYAAAAALGEAGVKLRGSRGAATTLERYGPGHYKRLALKRHGYNVNLKTSSGVDIATASGPAAPSGAELTPREDVPLRSASREPYAGEQGKSTDISCGGAR